MNRSLVSKLVYKNSAQIQSFYHSQSKSMCKEKLSQHRYQPSPSIPTGPPPPTTSTNFALSHPLLYLKYIPPPSYSPIPNLCPFTYLKQQGREFEEKWTLRNLPAEFNLVLGIQYFPGTPLGGSKYYIFLVLH